MKNWKSLIVVDFFYTRASYAAKVKNWKSLIVVDFFIDALHHSQLRTFENHGFSERSLDLKLTGIYQEFDLD